MDKYDIWHHRKELPHLGNDVSGFFFGEDLSRRIAKIPRVAKWELDPNKWRKIAITPNNEFVTSTECPGIMETASTFCVTLPVSGLGGWPKKQKKKKKKKKLLHALGLTYY